MLAELSLNKVNFRDYTLRAQMGIESFKISDVVSLVEGLDAGSIEFLISALNELIIADDMARLRLYPLPTYKPTTGIVQAKKLKDGVRLPILLDFEQSSAEVHFEKDFMWIGADYCFEENCQRISSTNSSSNKPAAGSGNQEASSGGKDQDVNYYDAAG